jgi:hypothetical protein
VVDVREEQSLLIMIENKRKEMLAIADEYGRLHIRTIECSKELDKLILEYQKLFIN